MTTLLAVVAHPDDETFGCGSLLLHAAAAGMTTVVFCATRGEAGESADGTPPDQLGAVREEETREAAKVLGVSRVVFGDLIDSGMSGEPAAGTLVAAPPEEVRDQVRAVIDEVRPTVVITLDAGDGHRDHAAIRDATLAAVEADGEVERVYLQCLPQSLMRRWVEHLISTDPSWEHLRADIPGTPDELITTIVDTSAHLDARELAIARHVTQRSPFTGLPADLYRDFLSADHLRRLRPEWSGGPRESDFVAG